MRFLVLINPRAGKGKTLKHLPKVKEAVKGGPHSFQWEVAESVEALRRGILKAPSEGIECLLLMGGDGTVHEALPALKQVGIPFGLLPCGRGNDFARNIGIPLDLSSNCAIPAAPVFGEIDVPVIRDRPFGSIACMGFDAEVNRLARDQKGHFGGTLGYIICVLRVLRGFIPFRLEIRVDDFFWSGRAMMVAISNGPYYGGGMKIAPQARMNDGLFDVCIIQEVSKWELLREFPKVFRGAHTGHPKVIMRPGKRVEVRSDETREIFADGEYVGNIPCAAEIGHQKIRVMQTPVRTTGNARIRRDRTDNG